MYINFTISEGNLTEASKSIINSHYQNHIIEIFFICLLLFTKFSYGQTASIVLGWSPNTESNISHYNLYRDTNAGTMVFLSSINHPDTTFSDNSVLENVTYYYKLTAVNTDGLESAPSEELKVFIGPPAITEQPSSITVNETDSAVFTVSATGIGILHYQWRRDGISISGATTDRYVLPTTSFAQDNGAQFDVIISNEHGTITSDVAILTVAENLLPPVIIDQPLDLAVTEPNAATFRVSANGNPQPAYQWRRNGINITGATKNIYSLSSTSFEVDDGAKFDVIASNSRGSVTSDPAVLTILKSSSGSLISSEDFESGWGIWNDGGFDCDRIRKYASSGKYSIRLRDNTSTSVVTTNSLDLTPYAQLEIQFSYCCVSMDNSNEDFWLQISTDGGSSYITIEEWNLYDEFFNNKHYQDSVLISGNGLTTTTKIRFRCDASANNDYVYIDDISIIGHTSPVSPPENSNQGSPIDITNVNINPKQPQSYQLFQNYPNPFNPTTTIPFDLSEESRVSLEIYNITGQLIRTLISDILSAGSFSYEWDARDNFGNKVASGAYIYRIKVGDFVETKSMILLK